MMIENTSIIPPKERLIKEYRYHASEYEHLNSNAHLDDYISAKNSRMVRWHSEEMQKLEKVLDALYPNWF